MGLLNLFSSGGKSHNFVRMICSDDVHSINMGIPKKELIQGFKKIDSLTCLTERNISTFIFTLYRGEKGSQPHVFQFEDRQSIPKLLKSIRLGDTLGFTMIWHQGYLRRVDKMIKILP